MKSLERSKKKYFKNFLNLYLLFIDFAIIKISNIMLKLIN